MAGIVGEALLLLDRNAQPYQIFRWIDNGELYPSESDLQTVENIDPRQAVDKALAALNSNYQFFSQAAELLYELTSLEVEVFHRKRTN